MGKCTNEPMLTARAAIKRLGVSLDFLYRLLWSGQLPGSRKVKGRWMIAGKAVEARRKQREARNG